MTKRNYALNPVAINLHNDAMYEPQRSNHFEAYFYLPKEMLPVKQRGLIEDKRKVLSLATTKFSLPNMTTNPTKISYGNIDINLPGKVEFGGADTFDCIDYIGADIEAILNQWQNLVFNPQTGQMGWAATYKVDGRITEFSPDGYCLATWVLRGCFPTNVQFGDFDKSNGDIKRMSCRISYDLAYRKYDDSNRSDYKNAVIATTKNMYWGDQHYNNDNAGGPITPAKDSL